MCRLRSTVALLALGTAFALTPAQAETLQQAIEAAYLQNPQIKAQRRQTAHAQEDLAQARAGWRPTVTASASFGYESLDTNRAFAFNIGDRPFTSAQLEAVQPLYAGGRINSGIRQARAGIGTANAQLAGTEQDLLLQVITVYIDVLRDRETIAIRQNSVDLLAEQLRAARDRFDVGVVTRTDVAQAEARFEGGKAALASAVAALEGSEAGYAFLIGSPATGLQAVPPAPSLPETVEDAIR
ncbi:MAG: TolC family protein, partial [Pseudomonadota bacterium]